MNISTMNISEIDEILKIDLDSHRYEHSKGVMYTACCLAMAHNYDVDKAKLAGLLHDCAKCISHDEKISLCKQNDVLINEAEFKNPGLLHAKAGAIVARDKFHVLDNEILHSITVHTTGAPDMSTLDKIIYIADYIEPTRTNQLPRLDYIRNIAFKDLDLCVSEILYDSLNYLNSKGWVIDPMTQITYDFYSKYRRD